MLLRSCLTGASYQNKFLWLNAIVNYNHSAFYIKEFANAEIYYHYHLVDDNNDYLNLSNLAQIFDVIKIKINFFKYVKLCRSIPEKWEGIILSSHFQRTSNNYLEVVKEN